MMRTRKISDIINSNNTIDLKGIIYQDYLKSKRKHMLNKVKILILIIIGVFLFSSLLSFLIKTYIVNEVKATTITNTSYQEDNYEEIIAELQAEALKIEAEKQEEEKKVVTPPKEIKEPVRVKKTYEEFMQEWEEIHDIIYKEQKWKQNTIGIIKKYEWLRLTSYCDRLIYTNWKYIRSCPTWKERYSIGYGSTSYKWETITEQEANKRVNEYLEANIFNELDWLTCWSNNKKTAIADFMYNSWKYKKHNHTWITFLEYVKRCDNWTVAQFLYPWNYKQKGLKKRRNAEWYYWTL